MLPPAPSTLPTPTHAPAPAPRRVPLAQLGRGQTGVVCAQELGEEDAAQLRAMGLGQQTRVRLCRQGSPCIVAIGSACESGGGCRIGLARPLAERIYVTLDGGEGAPTLA